MKMTESRYEALSALMPEGRYLLRRDSAKLTKVDRAMCLLRTHIIELVGHREKKILEIKGQTATWLEKEKSIELVGERVAHGKVYQITAHGRAAIEGCKALIESGAPAPWVQKKRVTINMLNATAARYGCVVKKNVARGWFELERKDGKELLQPALCPDNTRRPCRSFGLMTSTEWSASIARAALLKEPIEDDQYPLQETDGVYPQQEG